MKMILPELSKATIAKAENHLKAGWRYAKGEDTLTDYVAAASCYEKAARLGYSSGQYELAKCYFPGSYAVEGVAAQCRYGIPSGLSDAAAVLFR